MNTGVKIFVFVISVTVVCAASYKPAVDYWKKRNLPDWRESVVTRGNIVSVVNSTGTVKPVLSVSVGAVVSGPIIEICADFNDEVQKGELLARIDPRLFAANVARDSAVLATRKAEVQRVDALLQQAMRDEERAKILRSKNKDYISRSEMDQFKYNVLSLKAQKEVAECSVEQAEGSLKNSQANLEYTEIVAPVDGIVIDRKIDQGQSLACQFQTPELFIVAPDMRKKMYVFASVDEADIGLIRNAKNDNRPVHFNVDAYPDDIFEGRIEQIRMSSTTVQNVVTYPVVVAASNPDLKLMPGMTASISFEVGETDEVTKIPNAALRFYPDPKYVRVEDRELLEGAASETDDQDDTSASMMTAPEKAAANRKRRLRHVWVWDDEVLKAVEVTTGLSDNKFTELIEGDLKFGDKLVTGIKPQKRGWGS